MYGNLSKTITKFPFNLTNKLDSRFSKFKWIPIDRILNDKNYSFVFFENNLGTEKAKLKSSFSTLKFIKPKFYTLDLNFNRNYNYYKNMIRRNEMSLEKKMQNYDISLNKSIFSKRFNDNINRLNNSSANLFSDMGKLDNLVCNRKKEEADTIYQSSSIKGRNFINFIKKNEISLSQKILKMMNKKTQNLPSIFRNKSLIKIRNQKNFKL